MAFTRQFAKWPKNFRPLPGDYGAQFEWLASTLGTGGTALTGTATTTCWLPVAPVRTFSVVSAAMVGNVPANGSGTITAQLIKQSGGTATTLTAATSIKSDIITGTNVNAFDWPLTQADPNNTCNPGDTLRWEIVSSATAATAPVLQAVVEVAIMK